MASEVDICNLALSHLGADATVASINPPEGSAQAEHCAKFYPIARDSLQEHPGVAWSFCMRRAAGALLTSEASPWAYAYAKPNKALRVLAVLDSGAVSDVSASAEATSLGAGYSPQPFVIEGLESGAEVIYTNQANAVIRYTVQVTETARFSPLFVDCLSWLLASHLAGPVLKGDTGTAAARSAYQVFLSRLGAAMASDANQRRGQMQHSVAWLAGR